MDISYDSKVPGFVGFTDHSGRQREGEYPIPPGTTPIMGTEFSGIVEELGPGVTDIHAGDEVLGLTYGVSNAVSTTVALSQLTSDARIGRIRRIRSRPCRNAHSQAE